VIELAVTEPAEPAEPLGAQWLPTTSPGDGPSFRRSVRVAVSAAEVQRIRTLVITEFRETLASLGETLASLDLRMAAIERQLGIAAVDPEDSAAAEEAADPVESADPEEASPEEASPEEASPEESAQ
jgi:hypothetical protein